MKTSLTLAETVAVWRHETDSDPRPNKALDPTWLDILLHEYDHHAAIMAAALHGVNHNFSGPREPDTTLVRNHSSTRHFGHAIDHNIDEGQANGTYLALTAPVALAWHTLRLSPFGCVPKKDADSATTARLIHDPSHPGSSSTNACSSQAEIPRLDFESVRRIALRIEALAAAWPLLSIKLLKGDVKAAFRRIAVNSTVSPHFAGSYDNAVVIDLALPFGWTGSPAYYGIFGGAISFMVGRESPHTLDPTDADSEPFFSYVWVDDHLLVEVDRGNRLQLAEAARRLSMLATLGPDAINESKFSVWATTLTALGLVWNTRERTVSMPRAKVKKALARLREVIVSVRATRHQLEKLLGSLRHVGLCFRATRAFIQRLHYAWQAAPRFGAVSISAVIVHDLLWIEALLQHDMMNQVPMSVLAGTSQPDVHLFMDASDTGLAVLYPASREFIRVRFDAIEEQAIKFPTLPRRPASASTSAKRSARFLRL